MLDSMITIFNYLSVNTATNYVYRKMVKTDRAEKAEAEFESDIQKHMKKTKLLFCDGERFTLSNLMACVGNVCLEYHMVYKYPKEAVYYKMMQELLRFLHTQAG